MLENDLAMRVARTEQRVTDLDLRVNSLMPMATTVVTLNERVETLRHDFASFREKIEDRDEDIRKERRSVRLAIWSMIITIVVALIGATTVIVTAGLHHA